MIHIKRNHEVSNKQNTSTLPLLCDVNKYPYIFARLFCDLMLSDCNMGLPAKLTEEEQALLEKYALLKKMVGVNLGFPMPSFDKSTV